MATVLYQHDELFAGFTIRFEALPELDHIADVLDGDEEPTRTLARIDIGDLVLFVAKVTARRAGIELAETYLCRCIYATYAEFVDDSGCYTDMRGDVIAEAKIKLALLQVPDTKTARGTEK